MLLLFELEETLLLFVLNVYEFEEYEEETWEGAM